MIKFNIKELRMRHGWSQSELSQKANLSSSAICQFERGDRIPSTLSLLRLAKAFNLKVEDIVIGETPMPKSFKFKGCINEQQTNLNSFKEHQGIFPLNSLISFKFFNKDGIVPNLIGDDKLWEITIKEILEQ